jgi:hypothetical protein
MLTQKLGELEAVLAGPNPGGKKKKQGEKRDKAEADANPPSSITISGAAIPSVNGTYTLTFDVPAHILKAVGRNLTKNYPIYMHDENEFVTMFSFRGEWYIGYYKSKVKPKENWVDYYASFGDNLLNATWENMQNDDGDTLIVR